MKQGCLDVEPYSFEICIPGSLCHESFTRYSTHKPQEIAAYGLLHAGACNSIRNSVLGRICQHAEQEKSSCSIRTCSRSEVCLVFSEKCFKNGRRKYAIKRVLRACRKYSGRCDTLHARLKPQPYSHGCGASRWYILARNANKGLKQAVESIVARGVC